MIELAQSAISRGYDSVTATLRRIGQIAGLVTVSVVIFAALYLFVLYIGSE